MPTLTNEAKPVTKVEQEPFNKGGAFAIRRMADDVIELIVRIFLLGLVVYWTALLIKPFLSILVWSLILTVILHPAYEWLSRKLGGRRTISAGLVTLASLAIFTGPVIWLGIN